MLDAPRSPVAALAWQMWGQNRRLVHIVLALLAAGWVLNRFGRSPDGGEALEILADLLSIACFVLVFFAFSHTEYNPRRDRKGFPARLFTLPVPTVVLVAVPIVLGVLAAEVLFGAFLLLDLLPLEITSAGWAAFKVACFMLTYQMLLWCAAPLGALRMVLIGLAGFLFIVQDDSPRSLVSLTLWSLAAFGLSWLGIALQRRGAGQARGGLGNLLIRITDHLPARNKPFTSAHGAQLWYEWKQAGFLLPLVVCSLLLAIITPLSMLVEDPDRTLALLFWTLALPVLLALPIGKAYSKADTWSADPSVPAFLATRPLDAGQVVVSKLQVAAVSTAVSWATVLGFVSLWQFGWADTSGLRSLGQMLWSMQHHTLHPQFTLGILLVICAMLLTWRFLVAGLWIGLAPNRTLFIATTLPIFAIPTAGAVLLDEFRKWLMDDPTRLPPFVWCLAALVLGRFWFAAFSWRGINPALVHRYLGLWASGTLCAVALALLAAEPFSLLAGIDHYVARNLLLLAALMVLPLSQLGLAPASFARNRHR